MKYVKLFEGYKNSTDLIEKLKQFNVPIENWNTGAYKSIDNLMNEIKLKDTVLEEEDGKLIRCVEFVRLH